MSTESPVTDHEPQNRMCEESLKKGATAPVSHPVSHPYRTFSVFLHIFGVFFGTFVASLGEASLHLVRLGEASLRVSWRGAQGQSGATVPTVSSLRGLRWGVARTGAKAGRRRRANQRGPSLAIRTASRGADLMAQVLPDADRRARGPVVLDPRGLMAMACLATLDPRDNCGQASLRLSVARARKCLRGKPSPVACNVTQCSDVM